MVRLGPRSANYSEFYRLSRSITNKPLLDPPTGKASLVTISVCAEHNKDWEKGASETRLGSSSSQEERAVHN